jgi:hypothetical protein
MRWNVIGVLFIAIIIVVLFPSISMVFAYLSVPIQGGQIYDQNLNIGRLCGNFGTITRYDYDGGTNPDPFFYPTVESHSDSSGAYYVTDLKITVTGTKPDGEPIDGIMGFASQACEDSPHSTGSSWKDAMTAVCNWIVSQIPYGASTLLQYGQSLGGSSLGSDAASTWAEWTQGSNPTTATSDKGLEFRVQLLCDPSLTGLYILNVHYHAEISWRLPGGLLFAAGADAYDQIGYYFSNFDTHAPICAMKTLQNGYFYVPKVVPTGNSTASAIKFEMYDFNGSLVGDQTGSSPPYPKSPAIAHYPDGKKDGKDLGFVALLFGEIEGDTSPRPWDYMADVNGDHKIDGKDIAMAAMNFGYGGNYEGLDLPYIQICVNFNANADNPFNGLWFQPTANGFVAIPTGQSPVDPFVAENFTVFAVFQARPFTISATVTFWTP